MLAFSYLYDKLFSPHIWSLAPLASFSYFIVSTGWAFRFYIAIQILYISRTDAQQPDPKEPVMPYYTRPLIKHTTTYICILFLQAFLRKNYAKLLQVGFKPLFKETATLLF